MIELGEAKSLERQAKVALIGKVVKKVYAPNNPHKFCWFSGSPTDYDVLLRKTTIKDASGHGMFLDIIFGGNTISINDGTVIRYIEDPLKRPQKYQLLIEFEDLTALVFTVRMYGGIYLHQSNFDNTYYKNSKNSISPFSDDFSRDYFENLFISCTKDLSMKAFLATEQRIPGLGNGSLQDILLMSGLHPKRKISTLSKLDKDRLLCSLKNVLSNILANGGRDTECDLYGNPGKYQTRLSKNSKTCPLCGGEVIKETYLGGSIYHCPNCQKLKPLL